MKFLSLCVASVCLLSGAVHAQVVNIDAENGAGNLVSLPGSTLGSTCPTCTFVGNALTLGAGVYTVTPVDVNGGGLFTAANRFSSTSLPQQGWEWSLYIQVGSDALSPKYGFGEGITTNSPGYQASAADAFAVAPMPFTFTVTNPGTQVSFLWADDNFSDNRPGGISINVTAVPEPGTYAMLLAGLAAVAFVAKRRKI